MNLGALLLAHLALVDPESLLGLAVPLDRPALERRGEPYPPALEPLLALGARAVLVPVPWHVDTLDALPARGRDTPPDADLDRFTRAARRLGLRVLWMPIVLVDRGPPDHWRGVLAPRDERAWWRAYRALVDDLAGRARAADVDVLVIGSELTSLSGPRHAAAWAEVAATARRRFPGALAYATNHDALDRRAPFAHVDLAGVSAYFSLGRDADLDEAAMDRAWSAIAATLARFAAEVERPLVLLELGYPSIDGGATRPWDAARGGVVDLEEQRRAYAAATRALGRTPAIRGALFWQWLGPGGPHDRGYTPRGKPAEAVLRAHFLEAGRRAAAGQRR